MAGNVVWWHPGTNPAAFLRSLFAMLARTGLDRCALDVPMQARGGRTCGSADNARRGGSRRNRCLRVRAKTLRSLLQRAALACRLAPSREDLIDCARIRKVGGTIYLMTAGVLPIRSDQHAGRKFVFVEDYPHALGYGLISVVEFGADGPLGTPRPVLDRGSHLSYPFVFAHGDAVFMVPETIATDTIDLYRAVSFPDRWEKEATLLSGIEASDATLFEHDGRWWMFATVRDGGAYSDALHVWSAPDFRGPWQPHRRNPVLVDIASARPAGRVVRRNGALIRPFQDCRDGYGAALGLARITRLDEDGSHSRSRRCFAGPLWPGRRLHTLNRAGVLRCHRRLGDRTPFLAAINHPDPSRARISRAGTLLAEPG